MSVHGAGSICHFHRSPAIQRPHDAASKGHRQVRVKLHRLPAEILDNIFRHAGGHLTCLRLSSVSRTMRTAGLPYIFREIDFDASDPGRMLRFLDEVGRPARACYNICRLQLTNWYCKRTESEAATFHGALPMVLETTSSLQLLQLRISLQHNINSTCDAISKLFKESSMAISLQAAIVQLMRKTSQRKPNICLSVVDHGSLFSLGDACQILASCITTQDLVPVISIRTTLKAFKSPRPHIYSARPVACLEISTSGNQTRANAVEALRRLGHIVDLDWAPEMVVSIEDSLRQFGPHLQYLTITGNIQYPNRLLNLPSCVSLRVLRLVGLSNAASGTLLSAISAPNMVEIDYRPTAKGNSQSSGAILLSPAMIGFIERAISLQKFKLDLRNVSMSAWLDRKNALPEFFEFLESQDIRLKLSIRGRGGGGFYGSQLCEQRRISPQIRATIEKLSVSCCSHRTPPGAGRPVVDHFPDLVNLEIRINHDEASLGEALSRLLFSMDAPAMQELRIVDCRQVDDTDEEPSDVQEDSNYDSSRPNGSSRSSGNSRSNWREFVRSLLASLHLFPALHTISIDTEMGDDDEDDFIAKCEVRGIRIDGYGSRYL